MIPLKYSITKLEAHKFKLTSSLLLILILNTNIQKLEEKYNSSNGLGLTRLSLKLEIVLDTSWKHENMIF